MKTRNAKSFLIVLLMVIAAIVFVMQYKQINAWLLICLYWAVLTIKNVIDYKDIRYKGKEREGENDGEE